MPAHHVAVVAGKDGDGILAEPKVIELGQYRANATVYLCNKAEIFLFGPPILFRGGEALTVELLPQTISQWDVLSECVARAGIQRNLLQRMFVVKGTVIRRMRFDEGDKHEERFAAVLFEKFTRLCFNELRFGKFKRQSADKRTPEIFSITEVRFVAFGEKKFRVIAHAVDFFVANGAFEMFFNRGPFLEPPLRRKLIAQMPLAEITGAVIGIANQLGQAAKLPRQR